MARSALFPAPDPPKPLGGLTAPLTIPFTGEPPQFTRDPEGEEWHCPKCLLTTPAGVIPFPHQGDCPPGTIIHVWTADLAMGREFDRIEFDWPRCG